MELNDNGVKVSRTASDISASSSSDELTASSSDSCVTIGSINGNTITLNGGASVGSSTITVKYGSYEKTCTASVIITPTETSVANANPDITFKTDYGTIDVIWLKDDGKTVSKTPNGPVYGTGMSPVSWTEKATIGDDNVKWEESSTENYEYKVAAEKTDSKQSKWANAKLRIGEIDSYFVWIPRYAYRIIYYDKDYNTDATAKIVGYYDGWGMWKAEDGSVKYKLSDEDSTIETVEYNGNKYIVHPAFCDGSKNGYGNGQWSSDLKGFWVAKYEMSRNGATDSNAGSGYSTTFKSVPNVKSARSIAIGNMYTVAYNYDRGKESHLMKNSEWGAVAYLTQSQYGRNGHEIDINNSSSYITGNGGGSTSASSTSGTPNPYNTTTGAKASTTGNVYGVYDMSGGAWEYTAGYDKQGSSSYVEGASYGLNMTKEAKDGANYISTKYITAYSNGTSTYSGTKIYDVGKVGDATKEVYKGSGNCSWAPNSDYAYFVGSSGPFFKRGGYFYNGADAGVFYSYYSYGNSRSYNSFRAVLCP